MRLKAFAGETHQGPRLDVNEDTYDYDIVNNIFMVFDGFGGAGLGDQCVLSLKESIKKNFLDFSHDPNATLPFFYSPRYLAEGNALINSMLFSHEALFKANQDKEVSMRAGASGVIAVQTETLLTIASIGNCLALLVRHGKAYPLFTPDNYENLSLGSNQKHLSTMPTAAFGLYPDLYYQLKEVRLQEEDYIVFLTDGVYARLDNSEIVSVVINPKLDNKSKIRELFRLANSRGNLDNQTVFLCEY